MSDKLRKITSIISVVLFALAIVSGLYYYYQVMTMEPVPESVIVPSEKVDWAMERVGGSLEVFLDITYVMLFASIASILLFGIYGALTNKKALIKSITYTGFLLLIVLIAYIFSTSEIPVFFGYEKFNLTSGTALMVDLGLKSMYLLFVIAVGGVIFTGLRGYLKK